MAHTRRKKRQPTRRQSRLQISEDDGKIARQAEAFPSRPARGREPARFSRTSSHKAGDKSRRAADKTIRRATIPLISGRHALWRIAVVVAPEAEDAVANLLSDVFAQTASAYTKTETGKTTVAVWVDRKTALSGSKWAELNARLRRLRECGFVRPVQALTRTRVAREDWAESWKRHFKPFLVGRALLVRPSWSQRRPKAGQSLVVLDPGLSFGTGQHPTTRFCLEQIVTARSRFETPSCLDLGTGSGILAIAAAKLGYAPVAAIDNDPNAVRIAKTNAHANGVATSIRVECSDLAEQGRRSAQPYYLVCANLVADLLVAERVRIGSQVRSGGILVLAGILRTQFPKVRRAYEALGLKLIAQNRGGEWQSGAFLQTSSRR